jgi:transcriptional regulator with XRE-family HTH domain
VSASWGKHAKNGKQKMSVLDKSSVVHACLTYQAVALQCLAPQKTGSAAHQVPYEKRRDVKVTLGEYLGSIRTDRKLTLRAVEEATNKEVSNAYLSQIENGKIQRPSPNILYALANLYGVEYDRLMELAGYITTTRTDVERHGRAATFSELNLTQTEESELLKYLGYLRSKKD